MARVLALRGDERAAIDTAAASLQSGGVVVLPTDTVYGIAALPTVAGATDRVFDIKHRGHDVPLAVLVADAAQAEQLVEELPDWAEQLIDSHWPGPLTLVCRRKAGLRLDLGEPVDTLGVRCPNHRVVRSLARRVGPLATTSANRHGQPTPETAEAVIDQLGDWLPAETLVLDGGACSGTPSTVVDVTGDEPVVLRIGAIDAAEIGER